MSRWEVLVGDCRDVMSLTMADNSVDAIVTDPPYGLEFMGKAWDAPWKTDRRQTFDGTLTDGRATPYARSKVRYGNGASYGADAEPMRAFQAWMTGVCVEALRVLKPGGHMLMFGGSRTYHRTACAVEDAGFEIRDQLMWLYGSGFPKSKNLDGDWQGWGTALKPAHEPIVLARKPLIGTVAANVLAHGTGALNIDGCRVEFSGAADEAESKTKNQHGAFGSGPMTNAVFGKFDKDREDYNPPGRWPANVMHDGSDEVLAGFPESSVTGKRTSRSQEAEVPGTTWLSGNHKSTEHTDSGSAARFFYCPKASRKDRNDGGDNAHPTVKPTELMRYLCRLITPPGGLVFDPFTGSGSTGRGAVLEGFDFMGAELSDEYAAIARARIAKAAGDE